MNATQNPLTEEVMTRLTQRGWAVVKSNTRSDTERGHHMTELTITKEGVLLDLVSRKKQIDECTTFFGYATNAADDDDDFYNDLESIGHSHESALCGLITDLP
jgi:hypothetical protein